MADIFLPPSARFAQSSFHYIDSTGATRGIYSGAIETTAYGGDRFGATLTTITEGGQSAAALQRRAQLLAWLVLLKGKQNRIWMPDHAYRRRGSFPTGELCSDSGLSDVSQWSAVNGASLSATDGALRVTLTAAQTATGADNTVALTVNAPYIARAFLRNGRGTTLPGIVLSDNVSLFTLATTSVDGLVSAVLVPSATTGRLRLQGTQASGIQAGDFFECLYASVSRCALVDGAPNLLLHSDTPGGTSWSTVNMTGAVSGIDPYGLTTAYALTETSATGAHDVNQAVAVASGISDYTFSIYVCPGSRGWCALQMVESIGGTSVTAYFNLSTGALGSAGVTVGTNWANPRVFQDFFGNGWRRFTIVGRKTNAATSITCVLYAASADGVNSYAGSNASIALFAWRASLAPSSFPTQAVQTISAAAPAVAPTGQSMWLKGLPASTQGLLRTGDVVQVGTQLVMVMASLDSNAAGLGYLQFLPPLRRAPADNTPVVITNPLGRFSFVGQYPQWQNDPGVFSSASVDLEEACDV